MRQKITKLFRETWLLWVFCLCYGIMGGRETDEAPIPRQIDIILGLLFAFLITNWVAADARRQKRSMGYGFSALVLMFWPVFAPLYLFQTRGVRAFLSILAFIVMVLITSSIGAAIGGMTIEEETEETEGIP